MNESFVHSDRKILELLRDHQSLSVSQLSELSEVTATAVRQRLNRLMLQEFIERSDERHGRGRPQHRYRLTPSGRRLAGQNLADLATVLWEEIGAIEDPALKRQLLTGIARRLARKYAGQIQGDDDAAKMASIAELFGEKRIPMSVEEEGELPILNVRSCPYPDLANEDSSICEMEESLFSELLGRDVKLQECTVQGGCSCKFEPSEPIHHNLGELNQSVEGQSTIQ